MIAINRVTNAEKELVEKYDRERYRQNSCILVVVAKYDHCSLQNCPYDTIVHQSTVVMGDSSNLEFDTISIFCKKISIYRYFLIFQNKY